MNKGTQNETVTELHRTFKILMVGEASVGKTAIATRYVDQKFDHSMTATIGVDFVCFAPQTLTYIRKRKRLTEERKSSFNCGIQQGKKSIVPWPLRTTED